jgi:hypothetical protein
MQAIHDYCLWCSGGHDGIVTIDLKGKEVQEGPFRPYDDVKVCRAKECPLWLRRTGRDHRAGSKRSEAQRAVTKRLSQPQGLGLSGGKTAQKQPRGT